MQFPNLDTILTLSRVEVVSNLEVEAVKGAFRWVFEELQKQQTASRSFDPSAMQKQIQELLAARDEQKATAQALQKQQVCPNWCPCMLLNARGSDLTGEPFRCALAEALYL